ncbi:hypothetical protein INT47_010004 [Mucor saturninus]|uniref:Uncharacterized protein n=1 Tax=Mucor saturninus TaxID=64648 RepID=A0A8H7QJI3_9FUNG|nr:hypothetical protein INT47_010004 [Mucor saturninus]
MLLLNDHVKLADGETACGGSKNERQYNDIVFGGITTERELCRRKIDLLIRYGRENKDLELSSVEFKKPSVTAQQCKNLRVNGAILKDLRRLNHKIDSIVAMDWIGNTGYIYCLVPHHDASMVVIVAGVNGGNSVEDRERPMLDVEMLEIGGKKEPFWWKRVYMSLKSLIHSQSPPPSMAYLILRILCGFSLFEDFTLRVGMTAQHSLEERRKVDRILKVVDVAAETPSHTLRHSIFFTPTSHRNKRTKTEDNN